MNLDTALLKDIRKSLLGIQGAGISLDIDVRLTPSLRSKGRFIAKECERVLELLSAETQARNAHLGASRD